VAYGLTTVSIGDPTKASHHNENADSVTYLQGLLDTDHDFDTSSGTGDHKLAIGAPMHMQVETTPTVWTLGWFNDAGGGWWLLGNTADAATFTRGQAEFYIPTGDINDVPTS